MTVSALAAFLLGVEPAAMVLAQSTGSNTLTIPLRISSPGTITAVTGGATPLPFEISPAETMPPNSYLRLYGLPSGAALTEGYAVAPGSWAIALKALPSLKANFPAMAPGRSEVTAQLLSGDGAVLAESVLVIVFPAAANTAAVAPSSPPPPKPAARAPEPAPAPPQISAEDRQKAEKLLAQGDRYLDSGNVAVARQYFQRAADAGLAAGAMKLGATYDPAELERIAAQGVVPAPAEAKRWYERARALGAREADERIARLANTN